MIKPKEKQSQVVKKEDWSLQIENYCSKESLPKNDDILLPPDVTAISNEEMRDLHSRVIGWVGYRQYQLTKVSVAINYLKSQMALREARIQASYPQTDKWRFENICKRDEQWRQMQGDLLDREAESIALKLEIDKLEKRAAVLSREQSFREKILMGRM